jgi:hypothetical protein
MGAGLGRPDGWPAGLSRLRGRQGGWPGCRLEARHMWGQDCDGRPAGGAQEHAAMVAGAPARAGPGVKYFGWRASSAPAPPVLLCLSLSCPGAAAPRRAARLTPGLHCFGAALAGGD